MNKKKDLSDVNSSLLGGMANHKLTAESVPALCTCMPSAKITQIKYIYACVCIIVYMHVYVMQIYMCVM